MTGTGPAACTDGTADAFPCSRISLAKRVTLDELGASSSKDSWGWVDPEDGREYALIALNNRLSIVDVTLPAEPRVMGHVPTNTVASGWRDVKVFENHAFIVADNAGAHGMQVFDLRRVRGISESTTFSPDIVYGEFGSAHNIAINEASGFAYVVGSNTCAGGLHMIDIRVPINPLFAGCHNANGDTHDVLCVNYAGPDTEHLGKEICFGSNEDKVAVVDNFIKKTLR